MIWKVTTKDGELKYTPVELLNSLMGAAVKKVRPDHDSLAGQLVTHVQTHDILREMSIYQLVCVAFTLGYFYHVFTKNNVVEVIDAEEYSHRDGGSSGESGSLCPDRSEQDRLS